MLPAKYSSFLAQRQIRIRTAILLALFAVTCLHLLSSIPALYSSIQHYRLSREIQFLNTVSDDLYLAVGNYGYERGRVNVVLNDAGPVEKMEKNRQFIQNRRTDGDQALQRALKSLTERQTEAATPFINTIAELTKKVADLREKTARELIIPKEERTHGLAEIWFAAMTDYIESINGLLSTISSNISDADGIISRYSSLKHEILSLRNTAGPEMSILSATILSGLPIKHQLISKINNLKNSTQIHFHNITTLCQPLQDPQIPNALAELKKVYFDGYLPHREEIFSESLSGGPYTHSQPEFLSYGISALDQIRSLMNTTVKVTQHYADRQVTESRNDIIIQLVYTAGSLIIIILIFFYVHFRVISPIEQITSSVRRLARKNLDLDVPFQNAPNEIGEMAKAVEVFKGMAHQLDEDVFALESASVERERLITELQATLDEIKVLRGILPICSVCKKIRNDEGYYEQIEAYLHKHTGVDFSHTICTSCMERYYPELYENGNFK